MEEKHTVRIGISSARELDLEVDDPSVVSDAFESALKSEEPVLWITDTRDHRYAVAVNSIAFIEIEQPLDRGVGFGN